MMGVDGSATRAKRHRFANVDGNQLHIRCKLCTVEVRFARGGGPRGGLREEHSADAGATWQAGKRPICTGGKS